ncbi:MAG: hypothetical protein LUG88_07015 [Clostridia bacterium]|nr:hypothetical protein [Clostridia bacterium]
MEYNNIRIKRSYEQAKERERLAPASLERVSPLVLARKNAFVASPRECILTDIRGYVTVRHELFTQKGRVNERIYRYALMDAYDWDGNDWKDTSLYFETRRGEIYGGLYDTHAEKPKTRPRRYATYRDTLTGCYEWGYYNGCYHYDDDEMNEIIFAIDKAYMRREK